MSIISDSGNKSGHSVYALTLLAILSPLLWIIGCDKSSPAPSAGTASPTTSPSASAPTALTSGASTSAEADVPPGYSLAASTDLGKSLVTQKPNVASVQAALMSTFPDLETYFGNRPQIGSAYQDAHDSTAGGATFSAIYHNQPVRGIVSCKLHDGGAAVAVVFGRTDAPKSDWEKLMKPTPAAAPNGQAPAGAAPAAPVASAPSIPLKEYDYADGTGSVGLADGWTTQSQSACDVTAIAGPADQLIVLHNSANVSTPDSMAVRQRQHLLEMQAQNAANYARMGMNLPAPKPLPPLLVAPFTDPVTALQNMVPQFSKRSEFYNGPSVALDKILSSQDLPCALPNGKRALIDYTFTRTQNDESKLMRVQIVLVVAPVGQGDPPAAWMWFCAKGLQGPDATFDHDLPVMQAMADSEKPNQDRVMQGMQARNQQIQQFSQQMAAAANAQMQAQYRQFQQDQQTRADIHQQQMAQTQAGYDAHNQQFANYEWQRSRNAADFDESIIGTRTIYDTLTGESGYANLSDVNGVVDSLNQAALDPNRFVQIPLRDQLYPNPPPSK
jgi:hypothetical protein